MSILILNFQGQYLQKKLVKRLGYTPKKIVEGCTVDISQAEKDELAKINNDLRGILKQLKNDVNLVSLYLEKHNLNIYKIKHAKIILSKIGEEEGMMNFCIPYLTIEPIVSKLSSQFWFSSVRRSSTTQYLGTLKEKLSDVNMDVVAEIGTINLPIREVLALRAGDVVRLTTVRVGDPLTLSVGNEKKFYCQPGVVGKKMAVQVIGKIDQSESDEFEELSVEGDESYE